MSCRRISATAWILWMVTACGSQQKRDDGPVWLPAFLAATREERPNPLNWVEAQADEVYPDLDVQWNNPEYYGTAEPMTLRLQYWLDAFYDTLEAQDPQRFHHGGWSIPRPRVRIMAHPSINAFVSSRKICYRSAFTLEGVSGKRVAAPSDNDPNPTAEAILLISSKGPVAVYRHNQISCLDRTQSVAPVAWVDSYLRENIKPKHCTYRLENDRLVFDASCRVEGPNPQAEPSFIALESVTPWITITSGAIQHFATEEKVVLTLAHELVHYFHAHGALIKDNFQYFYKQTLANVLRARPLPDPELEVIGAALRKLPAFRTQEIDGQRYHSELFGYFRTALKHVLKPACNEAESPCHDACQDIITLGDDIAFQALLQRFPQSQLRGKAREAYFSYEKFFASCSAAIVIDAQAEDKLARVRPDTVKRIYWRAALEPLKPGWTLADAVDDMNRQLLEQQAQQEAVLQKAVDHELGYYTTEQEADLLSLQWLAHLGIDPGIARDYWLSFMNVSEEQDSPYNFAYERCLQVYSGDPRWTLAGKALRPPVGSFAEPHHSKCHRLYQVDQKLQHVAYPLGPDRLSAAGLIGGDWESLRAQAGL